MAADDTGKFKISQAIGGINNDSILPQLKDGILTFAKNAVVENFDGHSITYQNEQSNELCTSIKEGFIVIGQKNIVEQGRTLLFLVNSTTTDSEIGFRDNNSCIYSTVISSKCLGFSIDHPIHKIVIKTTNCSTQAYWTDGWNHRRWIDFDDLPFREITDPDNEFKKIKIIGDVDCNKLLVQPNFSIPQIAATQIEVGGDTEMGTYQFAAQYSNSLGEGYTSYYTITNPLGIFELKFTQDFNLKTTKAISLEVSDLDTSGLYDYFNLVVIKTVNLIISVELIGTFPINYSTFRTTYTGNTKTNIRLTIDDIFERFAYYDIAEDLTTVDNVLLWAKLKTQQKAIFQKIWAKVEAGWESYKIPYNKFEGYNNPLNTEDFRGYIRDEIYALEGCFILKNGRITEKGHIPGRIAVPFDREVITNKDALQFNKNVCDDAIPRQRWEIYNTASITGYSNEFVQGGQDDCYKGPYQYGEFAYWESSENYPNNKFIWGDLSGTPIRHHKFPDCLVSPIHDNNTGGELNFNHSIYPIGIKINADSLYRAIQESELTQEEKDQIVGFKIIRADSVSNESIIAKGLLYNVGKYTFEGQDYLYPNYTYNDLSADPFISSTKVNHHSGTNESTRLQGFNTDSSRSKFTLHSPDTSFYQPFGIDSGYLKLETVEYGKARGHFNEIKDNAKYKFLTNKALWIAFAAGMASGVSLDSGGGFLGVAPSTVIDAGPIPATFSAVLEMIKNLAPFLNYGYQVNSVGDYGVSIPIPNNGNKLRTINNGSYLIAGNQSVGGENINNFQRESSVYLSLGDTLLFPHEVDNSIPEDNSRYILSAIENPVPSSLSIADWYASLDADVRNRLVLHRADIRFPIYVLYTWEELENLANQGDTIAINIIGDAKGMYNQYLISRTVSDSCNDPKKIATTNISSYYGAIKRVVPDQYGRINSYQSIDTGFYHKLYNDNGIQYQTFPAVFGGDTFINRFSLKRKFPFFLDHTVGRADGSDIALNLIGNVGYPIFYYGTNQIDVEVNFDTLGEEINVLTDFSLGTIAGNLLSGGTRPLIAGINIMVTIFKAYLEILGVNNINLDCYGTKNLNETGKVYLFAYGIPYFFCESKVNVDYRQAINDRAGDYYPNMGSGIPDDWLQESNVPILNDNFYIYNKTYSKQNKETNFVSLREDFDPAKACFFDYPNLTIYSERASLEETKNNWLVYRPVSKFFFPKNYGELISIEGLEDRKILARLENKSLLYNVFATVNTSVQTAYLGNPTFFSQPPLDFAETDIGYNGTQHKFFLKTEFGHLTIDAIRGQIYLYRGSQIEEISNHGLDKWFMENLQFKIKDYFPDINIDNAFKDIGLTGIYDNKYTRFIITKRDYIPLLSTISYINGNFVHNNEQISIDNPIYFCNISWTLSYNLLTQSWISFHSYIPNYYISHPNYFETGIDKGIYKHNTAITFNKFYDKIEDYVLEYPLSFVPSEEIISSFSDYTTVLKYNSPEVYYEIEDDIYFNQAIIWNGQQCSGIRNLIPKPKGNMRTTLSYPKSNTSSIDILVTKSDNLFSFNQFWDIVIDKTKPFYSRPCSIPSLDKIFDTNLDYTIKSHTKTRIRSKEAKVRLIYNSSDQYKLLSKFFITETQQSIK